MGNKLKITTKSFIVNKLHESIKKVISFLESVSSDTSDIEDTLYKAYLEYIKSISKILLEEDVCDEYNLLINDIELINKQNTTNFDKLHQMCGKLIDLGMNIINNY